MDAGVKAATENGMVVIEPAKLKQFVSRLLEKVGVPPEDAQMVADVMVRCDLKGMESHGVRWMDVYLTRITAGVNKPVTNLEVVWEKPAVLVVDAHSGLGQVALTKAVQMGIAKARIAGSCSVAVRNSNHVGALGYYAELACREDMAIFLTCNAAPLMAPWGGVTPSLGTNPICFGFPSEDHPVVIDLATSASSRGKIFVAAQKGARIPEGCALNKDGEPTTDAKEAMEGLLLPLGGPKGYGLALTADIMGGILSGSNFGQNVPLMHGDYGHIQDIGHFAYIVNVGDFLPLPEYYAKMRESRAQLKGSQPAQGFSEVFLPGEIEANNLKKRQQAGASISVGSWKMLQGWAKKLGLEQ